MQSVEGLYPDSGTSIKDKIMNSRNKIDRTKCQAG